MESAEKMIPVQLTTDELNRIIVLLVRYQDELQDSLLECLTNGDEKLYLEFDELLGEVAELVKKLEHCRLNCYV